MTDRVIILAIIGALLALIALAGSALVWMAARGCPGGMGRIRRAK